MNASSFAPRNPKHFCLITATCFLLSVVISAGREPVWADPPRQNPDDTRDKRAPLTAAQLRGYAQRSRALVQSSRIPFANPPEIHSANDALQTTLTVDYAANRIGSDRVSLRSYGGYLVGPTLRIRPNDRLSIRIVNNLPSEAPTPAGHDINVPPHESNTTNLHTHGLHVSPEDNSDNAFLEIPPRGLQDYVFKLGTSNSSGLGVPAHPPGTHWYHPHKHGSVAIQLASGMAGALIVEGGLDDVPQIKSARERVFVFQQIPYSDPGAGFGTVEGARAIDRIASFPDDRYTTVNGLLKPVIELAPKEVERWRFIHAGLSVKLNLLLQSGDGSQKLTLYEIAKDGIALGRMDSDPPIRLSPGYRSDVLFKAPDTPGEYFLVKQAETAENALRKGFAEPEDYIARVVVCGSPHAMDLPDPGSLAALTPYPDLTGFQKSRTLTFDGAASIWKIDNKQFDPDRTDQCPSVGATEEWTITSASDAHPFHIHVNPFQVLSIKNPAGVEQLKGPVWKDTILLEDHFTIRFRTRFEHFPGKTVLHCHKLDHEDQGMMQVVRILPPCGPAPLIPGAEGVQPRNKAVPHAAASWRLPDAKGEMHELRQFVGKSLIVVFYRGEGCPHCVEQLRLLSERRKAFEEAGLTIVAISSDAQKQSDATSSKNSEWPFLVLHDRDLEVFKRYGCYENRPLHGVFAIDGLGQVRWSIIGEKPISDIDRIIEEGAKMSTRQPR